MRTRNAKSPHRLLRETASTARKPARAALVGCALMAAVAGPAFAAAAPRAMTIAGEHDIASRGDRNIAGTDQPDRFRYEVWGHAFTVSAGDLPAGNYCVEIDFAEFIHTERDRRVMSIFCGDTALIREMDIVAVAGGPDRAYTLSSEVRHPGGELKLRFESHKDNAKFGAIRVLNAQGEVVAEILAVKTQKPKP